MTYPRFSSGAYGRLKYHHLNDLFDDLADLRVLAQQNSARGPSPDPAGLDRTEARKHSPFIATIGAAGRQPNINAPLDQQMSWISVGLSSDGTWDIQLGRDSSDGGSPPFDFAFPAYAFTPPNFLLVRAPDESGDVKYAYIAAPSVYHAEVESVSGNTYTVVTVDDMLRFPNMTPIDRWPNVNYLPLAIGDPVLVLVKSQDISQAKLIAFEDANVVPCPAQFAGQGGLVDLASAVGL